MKDLAEIAARIDQLPWLGTSWDHKGALNIAAIPIARAWRLIITLSRYSLPRSIEPSTDGGVIISYTTGVDQYEIYTIRLNGWISFEGTLDGQDATLVWPYEEAMRRLRLFLIAFYGDGDGNGGC
jgi:hypothetical protein